MKFKNYLASNIKFLFISFLLTFIIVVSALYVSSLLYSGKNSYAVYSKLKSKKIQLQDDIRSLQLENAALQKKYLELKNLEPEEL